MTLTPEQKEHAIDLIEMGEKLEAVRYFQQVLSIDAEQALLLAEKLEKEVEPEFDQQELLQKAEEMKRSGAKVGRLVGLIFMSIGIVLLVVAGYFVMAVVAFGIGRWLGGALDGSVMPFALGLGFWSAMTCAVAWTLVRRHG